MIARQYSYAQGERRYAGIQLGENRRHQFNGILASNTAECQQRDFEGTANGNFARAVGKSLSMGMDDGVSTKLGRIGADAPDWLAGIGRSGWWKRNQPPDRAGIDGKRIKGRRACINHYGAACTPMQAVPMASRIKYLAGLLD